MIIEIHKNIPTKVEIDIELPYYYRQDLESDYGESVIYGMLDGTYHFSIHEKIGDTTVYEIEHEPLGYLRFDGFETYFKPMYKSSKTEFDDVARRANALLAKVL